jgi:xanthine/uracil/vitamin C permease (AzgA family)
MRSVFRLFSPIAAALTGALAVGLLASLVMLVYGVASCTGSCDAHRDVRDLLSAFAAVSFLACTCSVLLGTLPGIVALTLTPAARQPWRSLPVLVVATTIGFVIWSTLELAAPQYALNVIGLFVLPSATGLVAAAFIDRLPARLRFGS